MFYLMVNGHIVIEKAADICDEIAWSLAWAIPGAVFTMANAGDLSNSFYFDHFAC